MPRLGFYDGKAVNKRCCHQHDNHKMAPAIFPNPRAIAPGKQKTGRHNHYGTKKRRADFVIIKVACRILRLAILLCRLADHIARLYLHPRIQHSNERINRLPGGLFCQFADIDCGNINCACAGLFFRPKANAQDILLLLVHIGSHAKAHLLPLLIGRINGHGLRRLSIEV